MGRIADNRNKHKYRSKINSVHKLWQKDNEFRRAIYEKDKLINELKDKGVNTELLFKTAGDIIGGFMNLFNKTKG